MDPVIHNGVGLVTGAGSGKLVACPVKDQYFETPLISPGMGQKICLSLVERGCSRLLLADIVEQGLHETRARILESWPNTQIITHVTDVSQDASVANMVARCASSFGRLDFAINCAGIAKGSIRTIDTTLKDFEQICSVNEKGVCA
jgi:NAD(P)-dependent dehydrogenase (short-subunit alcohol dehydrogenase family)